MGRYCRRHDYKAKGKTRELFIKLKKHPSLPQHSIRWRSVARLVMQPLLADVFSLQTVNEVTKALEISLNTQLLFFLDWYFHLPIDVLLQTTRYDLSCENLSCIVCSSRRPETQRDSTPVVLSSLWGFNFLLLRLLI